jgi:tRNA modification GTPase
LGQVAVSRLRQRQNLVAVVEALQRFPVSVQDGAEFGADELRIAADALGRITGAIGAEDVLGAIFSSFCIGK